MHPAFSVIFFTTCSGAGYGLLALMGIYGASDLIQPDLWVGLLGFGFALGLVTIGLLASTIHLGRPERAWRALTQWRSSWLSREGIAAVLTYIPAGLFGIGWVFYEDITGLWGVAGVVAAVLAWVTVACTAMIYRSLPTIHQWHNDWTVPSYIVLSLMSGAVLLNTLTHLFDIASLHVEVLTVVTLVVAWALKSAYWDFNKNTKSLASRNSAIGVDAGIVRPLEAPHTEDNYLLKEMGFQVGRKHADKLRGYAHLLGFAVPLVLTIVSMFMNDGLADKAVIIVAWGACSLGIITERWLFFAEAKHTVTLYYGNDAV